MSYLLNVWMIFTFLSFPVVKVGDNIERELFQTFPCWALKFSFMAPLKPRRTYKIGKWSYKPELENPSTTGQHLQRKHVYNGSDDQDIKKSLKHVFLDIFFSLIFECNSTSLASYWKILEIELLTPNDSGTSIE